MVDGTPKPSYAIQINYPFANTYNLLQNAPTQANIDSSVDKGLPPSVNSSMNDVGRYYGWRVKGRENMAYQGTQSQTTGFSGTQENLQNLPDEKQSGSTRRTRPARRSSARLKAAAQQGAEKEKEKEHEQEQEKNTRDSGQFARFEDAVAAATPTMVEPPRSALQSPPEVIPQQSTAAEEKPVDRLTKVRADLAALNSTFSFAPAPAEEVVDEVKPAEQDKWNAAKTVEEFIPIARAHARRQLGLQPEDGSMDEDEASEIFLNALGSRFSSDVREYGPEKQQAFFKKFGITGSDQQTVLENGGRARQIVTDALIVWEKNQLKLPKHVSYSEIENAMHAKNFEILV